MIFFRMIIFWKGRREEGIRIHTFFYKQHFHKQREAEIGKSPSKF